jgi:small GTP-binding protein
MDLDPEVLKPLVAAIEEEFQKFPPTIAVIGLSGVGKSSTINAIFGTNRDVSATTRGTSRFHKRNFDVISNRVYGTGVRCTLRIIDAPGLGEDASLDRNYLQRYRQHLSEADIALWVLAARNRALALDQQYLEALADVLPPVVLGINQVDLVDPLTWIEATNLPSREQAANIETILKDRSERIGRVLGRPVEAVAFSALRYYNLQALFKVCLDQAPSGRRWMFEVLKSFTTRDWLAQAKGLSAKQRQDIEARFGLADKPIQMGRFSIEQQTVASAAREDDV